MASYRLHVNVVSRGKGQSVIAKAAYNSREAIRDERTGEMKDYSRKKGVEFSGIFAPKDAPEWAANRATLWNAVEAREDQQPNKKNRDEAQLARNVELSIPHELNADQRRQLVRDFVREQFVRRGMIADVAIHAPDKGSDERNYHAHVLLTMREVDGGEFAAKKNRDWNSTKLVTHWREKWAELGARYIERAGFPKEAERHSYSHLTLPEQRREAERRGDYEHARALDREATTHHGPHVSAMERRGTETEIGNAYRDIVSENKERAKLQEINQQIADRVIFLAANGKQPGTLVGGDREQQRATNDNRQRAEIMALAAMLQKQKGEPHEAPANDNEAAAKERMLALGFDPAKPATVAKWQDLGSKVDAGRITEKDRIREMAQYLWHEADKERRTQHQPQPPSGQERQREPDRER